MKTYLTRAAAVFFAAMLAASAAPASVFAEDIVSTSSAATSASSAKLAAASTATSSSEPAAESVGNPGSASTETPGTTPTVTPGTTPTVTPGATPTVTPGAAPTETPGTTPTVTLGTTPASPEDGTSGAGNAGSSGEKEKEEEEKLPEKAPEGEEEAQKHTGSNEELIRSQNIIDLPEVLSGDWRFQKVEAEKSIAREDMSILTEKKDNAAAAGTLKRNGYAFILSDEGDGWVYVESGSVRGFAKSSQFYSGREASRYRQEESYRLVQNAVADHHAADLSCFKAVAEAAVSPSENLAYLYKHLTAGEVVADKVYGIVSTQSTPLMMRESEDVKSKSVGNIPKGGLLYILEDDGSDFLYVESGDTKGFVRRQYIRTGDDVNAEVEKKGEDSYAEAKKLVDDDENAALYHTFTSIKEYQAVNPVRQQILDLAQTTLGHPYVWGGNDIYNGCDCSGLVQQIYARVGISLPRVAEAQAQVGTKITPASAQPGDLIFYAENGYIYHVAIYAGEGKTVEAYGTDYGILSTTAFSGRPVCWCTNVIDELN